MVLPHLAGSTKKLSGATSAIAIGNQSLLQKAGGRRTTGRGKRERFAGNPKSGGESAGIEMGQVGHSNEFVIRTKRAKFAGKARNPGGLKALKCPLLNV
jgi:hypothetical protein